MMRVAPEGLGNDPFKLRFDLVDGLPGRKPGAVADAEDMGIDREGFLAERGVEHDIGRLAADAGKLLQLFPGGRDLAPMALDQRLAERNDIPRLGVEKADRLDRFP